MSDTPSKQGFAAGHGAASPADEAQPHDSKTGFWSALGAVVVAVVGVFWSAGAKALTTWWHLFRYHWYGCAAAVATALLALIVAEEWGLKALGKPTLYRHIKVRYAPAVRVHAVRRRFDPPYLDAILLLENLPQGFSTNGLWIVLDDRRRERAKGEFSLRLDGRHKARLTIPCEQFPWGSPAKDVVSLVIRSGVNELFRGEIPLAHKPSLALQSGPNVAPLSSTRDRAGSLVPCWLVTFVSQACSVSGSVYAVGPGPVTLVLPKVLAKGPRGFSLSLDGQRVAILNGATNTVELLPLGEARPGTFDLHEVVLHFRQRQVGMLHVLRYVEPLVERMDALHHWEVPPHKRRWWRYDARAHPHTIHTTDAVAPGVPGSQPHYNIKFPHLTLPVEAGQYIVEQKSQGLGGGSLSLVFADFEAVVPSGVGQPTASFKLSGDLNWKTHEQADATARWSRPGIELRFDDADSEIKFPLPKDLDLSDDGWHTATLVVLVTEHRIGREPRISFTLYLDGREVAHCDRPLTSRSVEFTPELRHRGCRHLAIRDFRIYHVGEN